MPLLKRLSDKKYSNKDGYKRIDFGLHDAAWNLERSFGFGNWRSNSGLYSWEGTCQDLTDQKRSVPQKIDESPEELSRLIKRAALFFGADLVGICRLNPNWVYSHEFNVLTLDHYPIEIPQGCDNVIALAVAMDYIGMRSSPTAVAGAAQGLGYSQMAFVANTLATFIRSLGYRALPCGNDTALSIPIAMAAGLGEWSRMGLLITEKFGPRVRLFKIFTDMPLKQDAFGSIGVVEFCKTCKICATRCPSQAIPDGDMTEEGPNMSSHSSILKWYIDGERCYSFWAKNHMGCAICIRVCPFNQRPGKIHDLVRFIIRKTTILNKLFVRLHGILKYDKPFPAQRFWDS
jgi:reductive dehalogenase